MARINVYDTDEFEGIRSLAGWFDDAKAESFAEDTRWDGDNHISIPTGSQWSHEMLYRTSAGRWVLHGWSQWQGSQPSYGFVSDGRAREWLFTNGHDGAAAKHFGPVEEERGPGRPEVGAPINVRLGDQLLTNVDAWAAIHSTSRSEAIRRLVFDGLRAVDR